MFIDTVDWATLDKVMSEKDALAKVQIKNGSQIIGKLPLLESKLGGGISWK